MYNCMVPVPPPSASIYCTTTLYNLTPPPHPHRCSVALCTACRATTVNVSHRNCKMHYAHEGSKCGAGVTYAGNLHQCCVYMHFGNTPGWVLIYNLCSNLCSNICSSHTPTHTHTHSHYHAALSATEREAVQTSWTRNQVQIIVATIAFGMGMSA